VKATALVKGRKEKQGIREIVLDYQDIWSLQGRVSTVYANGQTLHKVEWTGKRDANTVDVAVFGI